MIEEHFKESAIQFRMTDYPGREAMSGLAGVTNIAEEDDEIILYTENISATIPALLNFSASKSTELSDLSIRHATLEDVFLKLTGKRIRD